jgi:hypothetical protein
MRPHGRAKVDPNDPRAFGECSRCGFWFQLQDLQWQMEWAGTKLYNTGLLVCTGVNCLDVPNEQFRTIILPPDPMPVLNARTPNFAYEEQTIRITQFADPKGPPWAAGPQMIRCTQDGETARALQYETSS